eukprot:4919175-Amphidinium_carterae.1
MSLEQKGGSVDKRFGLALLQKIPENSSAPVEPVKCLHDEYMALLNRQRFSEPFPNNHKAKHIHKDELVEVPLKHHIAGTTDKLEAK